MAEIAIPPGRGKTVAAVFALVALFSILMALGTWQVYRLAWKEQLIAEIEARRHAAPAPFAEIDRLASSGADVDYRPVRVTGRFDFAHERFFLATGDGAPGYHVYAPLLLADGRAVFVNRGFVPEDLRDPAKRAAGQVPGEVTITGLARNRLTGKPSSLVPDNDPARQLYFWKDLEAMAAGSAIAPQDLVPLFIDADATPNPGGWPKGGVTQIDLPNNHLSYAVTWYGLGAALLVIGLLTLRKKKQPATGS